MDSDALRAAVDRAAADFGRLDILVNNAGGVSARPFLEQSERSMRKHVDINLMSMLIATQAAAKHMVAGGRGGSIVNVSSQASLVGLAGHVSYASSKGAVDAMTRVSALELGPHGIRVNAVNPTVVMTPMSAWYWGREEIGGPVLNAMFNKAKWDELPAAYQSVLDAACRAANADMMASYDYKNPSALRQLVADGAQLRPFSQEILEACYNAAMETYEEINASNPTFKKIYDNQQAFKKDAYLWAQLSEYTFDTFMMIQQRAGKL